MPKIVQGTIKLLSCFQTVVAVDILLVCLLYSTTVLFVVSMVLYYSAIYYSCTLQTAVSCQMLSLCYISFSFFFLFAVISIHILCKSQCRTAPSEFNVSTVITSDCSLIMEAIVRPDQAQTPLAPTLLLAGKSGAFALLLPRIVVF